VLPVTEEYELGELAWSPLASGWLPGAVREGREATTYRSKIMPERFDMFIPSNRARIDAVEQLAKVTAGADLTMIQLALGSVTAHPGVTTALLGPRMLNHLHAQLAAADMALDADGLGAIVIPGTDLAGHEKHDTPPAPLDTSLWRR